MSIFYNFLSLRISFINHGPSNVVIHPCARFSYVVNILVLPDTPCYNYKANGIFRNPFILRLDRIIFLID